MLLVAFLTGVTGELDPITISFIISESFLGLKNSKFILPVVLGFVLKLNISKIRIKVYENYNDCLYFFL